MFLFLLLSLIVVIAIPTFLAVNLYLVMSDAETPKKKTTAEILITDEELEKELRESEEMLQQLNKDFPK